MNAGQQAKRFIHATVAWIRRFVWSRIYNKQAETFAKSPQNPLNSHQDI